MLTETNLERLRYAGQTGPTTARRILPELTTKYTASSKLILLVTLVTPTYMYV